MFNKEKKATLIFNLNIAYFFFFFSTGYQVVWKYYTPIFPYHKRELERHCHSGFRVHD